MTSNAANLSQGNGSKPVSVDKVHAEILSHCEKCSRIEEITKTVNSRMDRLEETFNRRMDHLDESNRAVHARIDAFILAKK